MMLNVAATVARTRVLGPGLRAVVWVQGCPFDCAGCVAPDWIPDRSARLIEPAELADKLAADPELDGLTFSGGEPMAQAAGLAELARHARERRPELTLVCFTGFRLERLRSRPPSAGVPGLLAEVDVLIDGVYVEALNDNRGLRGSSNQRVQYLTDRLRASHDSFQGDRHAEVRIGAGELLVVGVPPHGLLGALDNALGAAAGGDQARDPTRSNPGTTSTATAGPATGSIQRGGNR